jgi:hypothetical protein
MSLPIRSVQPGGRKKERLMLIVAIVLGLLAGGANWVYLRRIEKTKLTVLKAKKRIPAATQVDGSLFEEVTIAGDVEKMKSLFVAKEDFGAFKKAILTRRASAVPPPASAPSRSRSKTKPTPWAIPFVQATPSISGDTSTANRSCSRSRPV